MKVCPWKGALPLKDQQNGVILRTDEKAERVSSARSIRVNCSEKCD